MGERTWRDRQKLASASSIYVLELQSNGSLLVFASSWFVYFILTGLASFTTLSNLFSKTDAIVKFKLFATSVSSK